MDECEPLVSGLGILVRQWIPSWLGGGPTCPTMAAMQSHLPYVTDYSNVARRQAGLRVSALEFRD